MSNPQPPLSQEVRELTDLAQRFSTGGRYEEAADILLLALRLDPKNLGRAEYERKQFEAALSATVHAFLLLNDGDEEGVRRLRRRIQTLKQILGWGNRELASVFRERQEMVHTSFDRLEWHRERFLEQGGLPGSGLSLTAPPPKRGDAGGQLEL